jgi:TRAP-type mannitol/chloroaromatic compound transport system permease small subunit
MRRLLTLAVRLERIVVFFGRLAGWVVVPLIAVIIFDILTRKFYWSQQLISNSWAFDYISSGHLQDWEWHLHTVLFLLVLGYAYVRNAHVRVDLVREKLSPRAQAWVEFLGCLVFLIPFVSLLTYLTLPFLELAWKFDEQSQSFTGLKHRWIIKSFLLPGFLLALMAGVAVLLRCVVYLFGPVTLREAAEPKMISKRLSGTPVRAGATAPDDDLPHGNP